MSKSKNSFRETWRPPGHFYSPIPDIESIQESKDLWSHSLPIQDIDLNTPEQLKMLEYLSKLAPNFSDVDPSGKENQKARYNAQNSTFAAKSASQYAAMIRFLKPQHVIEVGAGYSSAVLLDTNEMYLDDQIRCDFIDPDCSTMRKLLKSTDTPEIHETRVQNVGLELFDSLKSRDILFIDSSHICKTHSDLNWIVFKILPRLDSGVYIHFHDILYPFEYSLNWIEQGRAWNEVYLLRAFLQNNSAYKIVLWGSYLSHCHRETMRRHPTLFGNVSSLWIRKL